MPRANTTAPAPTATPRAPRPAPPDTRRMMLARVSYLFDVARAAWNLHPRKGVAIESATLTATPDAVTDLACERLTRAVTAVAPRYAPALLRDELLVWRFPLRATFLRSPLSGEQREDEHLSSSLYRDPTERNRVLWCIAQMHASGFVPRGFPVDPRAAYEDEPRTEGTRNMRARDEADGLRLIEDWSVAWPPGVEVSRVCEMLRATGAPEAAAVADDIRGTVFGGPDAWERLGARVGPVETLEQGRARRDALVKRWGETTRAEGWSIPLSGGDAADVPPEMLINRGDEWGPAADPAAIARAIDTAPRWLIDAAASCIAHVFRERWSPAAVAHIAAAVDRIQHGQRAASFFAVPAAQVARVPFEMMARAESFADESHEVTRVARDTARSIAARRVTWRVVWDGRPRDRGQMAFGFAAAAATADVFRDILAELGAEGLRDYVILHRMAAEQGRTGRFRWTWEAHKRATAHEARVRTGKRRDEDMKRAALGHIAQLRSAELHVEAYDDHGRRAWRVVGEAPLVSIVGGVEARGGDVEGLELVLNPTLYRTAAAGGEELYFTQLPEAVLSLPALAFSLAVMLGFRCRGAADDGGAVTIPKAKLHEYMDAGRWRRGDAAAAEETLSRALARVAGAFGHGATFEEAGEGVRFFPGGAFIAAVVDRVPPSLPASTASAPRTGAELRAWRDRRKLSQVDAARALGVGKRTIVRAELAPDAPLPRAFKRATWGASTRPGPVEGEGSQGGG